MKLKEENFELKSENMIKQQNLEKSALAQKMNSEYDEMNKIKQVELEKIVTKYKNKKYELETKQGKEKNIHDNENMLKASLFNTNLVNFTNPDNMMSINKSVNKSTLKMNPFSDKNLREISSSYGKRPETAKSKPNTIGLGSKKNATKSNISFNSANLKMNNNPQNINKSLKLFSNSTTVNNKERISSNGAKNLQYNSNLN